MLELINISKSFGSVVASDEVSLTLKQGEIHALIGPNGAGKSTLIKQIAGELRPDSGRMRFEGRDIGTLSQADRARAGLARSFQVSSVLPDFSVLRNVMVALMGAGGRVFRFWRPVVWDKALVERAQELLQATGLGARSAVKVAELSHGERRRLEIAMALALTPKAFLLDEPMAGMGAEGTADLTRLLDGLRAKAPILLVEHDMDAVFALADRITVLSYGRVLASGTVDAVRADAEVRAAYLGDAT